MKSVSATGSVSVVVGDLFLVTVSGGSLLFKDLTPGVEVTKVVTVAVTTNAGVPWKLKMFAAALTMPPPVGSTAPGTTVPDAAFQYSVSGPGAGVYAPPSGLALVSANPADIYSSGPADNVVVNMTFSVTVSVKLPSNLAAGTYNTVLNFTLATTV